MWYLGYPKGSALELLDGTLKLRHCTTFFYHAFSPHDLHPGLAMGVVKDSLLLLVISWMKVVTRVKGSGLPGRHVQVHLLVTFRIQGFQRRGDGKDCAPLPLKERGVRWACLAIFFLDSGLGEVFALGTPGTCLQREQAQDGVSALALTQFNWFLHLMRNTTSAPQPPQGVWSKRLHTSGDRRFLVFRTPAVAMDGERGSGAALRRRERRLNAWQRHVRTAVQPALAEKVHHSANKVEPHDAPRTGEESWQGGGRSRDALWPTGTDAPTSGDAACTSV